MKLRPTGWILLAIVLILPGLAPAQAASGDAATQKPTPGDQWMHYETPEYAGWSSEDIDEAKAFADSIGTAAFLLIHDGVVVASYGDYARRYMVHSVRKSLLSALIGIYVEKGAIDPEKTLGELGIDDRLGLTETEKSARVIDLLRARSGVYHPSAYESPLMAARRPERGSHEPGTFFYYNNWDFNALGMIFRQVTGQDVFEAFDRQIAEPLGMRDFRPRHGYYHLEPEHSVIPAYPIRMSARDLARFGLLFAREGRWEDEQIVPAPWVGESTRSHSQVDWPWEVGYGYMWWVLGEELGHPGAYAAMGSGGQRVIVLPENNVVFVHLVDTYADNRVEHQASKKLLGRLLDARRDEAAGVPRLVALDEPKPAVRGRRLPDRLLERYSRTYEFPSGHKVEVTHDDGQLTVYSDRFGAYRLVPLTHRRFLVQDRREIAYFVPSSEGEGVTLVHQKLFEGESQFLERAGRHAEAVTLAEQNATYYPASADAQRRHGEVLVAAGNESAAVPAFRRALALDPTDVASEGALVALGAEGFRRAELASKTLEPYVGEYRTDELTVTILLREGKLYLDTPSSEEPASLVATSETTFYRTSPKNVLKLVFVRDTDGAVVALEALSASGSKMHLEKMEESPL